MLFDIVLEVTGFSGTFDMLVEQVRRHELDILHVRLSEVANRLIEEIKPKIDLHFFTPFLSLSKLMFLKSRNLLPGQDQFADTDLEDEAEQTPEEAPTKVRERLLEQYQVFISVREQFRLLEEENAKRIRAVQTRAGAAPGFIDEIMFLEKATPFDLLATMAQIERRNREDRSLHVRADEAKRLSERIAEVFGFVLERQGEYIKFSEIVSKMPQKREAVLSFLAVVYLVADGRITARQKMPYSEILITAAAG